MNRSLLGAAFIAAGFILAANGQTPSPSIARPLRLAPYKERLAAAKSVKVQTAILGIELDSSLDDAQAKLSPLSDSAQPATGEQSETGEREHKVVWRLAKTDFASVFLKADDKERITYIAGFLRPGKEVPFAEIGQLDKAPLQTESVVAWDVVRANRPLIRVVARGSKGKANSITLFIVKRPTIGARGN
jgi:hypothetical protein